MLKPPVRHSPPRRNRRGGQPGAAHLGGAPHL